MGHSFPIVIDQLGIFGVVVDGRWSPGIGDPTPMGWFTCIAYGIACALCIQAAYKKPKGLATSDTRKHLTFWSVLGIVMLLLTINKQLDLQLWFWLTGRNMVKEHGWSEYKKTIQILSMFAVSVMAAGGLAFMIQLTRGVNHRPIFRHRVLALSGTLFIVAFVMIRAISLSSVDQLLGWRLSGLKLNWILENIGILIVSVGAYQAVKYSKGLNVEA